MIDDYSQDLFRTGIIEAKAGNKETARRFLDRALYMSSDHEVMAEIWFWISQITDDPAGKREALENCLSNDLQHTRARRALAILDGRIKPDEIVDPEHLPPASEGPQSVDSQRLMCSKCGGRMTFSPDGRLFVCEYCARSQAIHPSAGSDKDFMVAMATMRGHGKPFNEQVFKCQGCGAEFILAPGQLSGNCTYCGSPSVVMLGKSKDLLAPDSIIPHTFDQLHASHLLMDWTAGLQVQPDRDVEKPRGVYLPLWTFDLGGWIDYTGEVLEQGQVPYAHQQPRMVLKSDRYPVMLGDVPIPASRKLSAPFVRLITSFDLKVVRSYDPGYLADWPAELYDVPLADASLDAREAAFIRLKREIPNHLYPLHLISLSSANMTVESFRLNLLPVWMAEIWLSGRSYLVLINGQNGALQSDWSDGVNKKESGLKDWLADILKD